MILSDFLYRNNLKLEAIEIVVWKLKQTCRCRFFSLPRTLFIRYRFSPLNRRSGRKTEAEARSRVVRVTGDYFRGGMATHVHTHTPRDLASSHPFIRKVRERDIFIFRFIYLFCVHLYSNFSFLCDSGDWPQRHQKRILKQRLLHWLCYGQDIEAVLWMLFLTFLVRVVLVLGYFILTRIFNSIFFGCISFTFHCFFRFFPINFVE